MKKPNCFVTATFVIMLLFQNIIGKTTALEGVWEGSSFHSFFGLSYIFNFKSDSVFITEKFCNDIPDPCHNSHCYNTFFACTFVMTRDSILIKGNCADSTFKINTNNTGCRFGPAEVCEYSLKKRFHLSKDTIFLNVCDEDCAEKLIKKTTGTIISQKDYNSLTDLSEINLHVNNYILTLTLPRNQPLYDLKIVSTQGRTVYRESFISGVESFRVFSPGVYLLSAKTTDGRTVDRKFHVSF